LPCFFSDRSSAFSHLKLDCSFLSGRLSFLRILFSSFERFSLFLLPFFPPDLVQQMPGNFLSLFHPCPPHSWTPFLPALAVIFRPALTFLLLRPVPPASLGKPFLSNALNTPSAEQSRGSSGTEAPARKSQPTMQGCPPSRKLISGSAPPSSPAGICSSPHVQIFATHLHFPSSQSHCLRFGQPAQFASTGFFSNIRAPLRRHQVLLPSPRLSRTRATLCSMPILASPLRHLYHFPFSKVSSQSAPCLDWASALFLAPFTRASAPLSESPRASSPHIIYPMPLS